MNIKYEYIIIDEPLMKVKKDIPQMHWKNIYEKWLHDEYKYVYRCEDINKSVDEKRDNNIDIGESINVKNNEVMKEKKVKWKTIIEIYMEVMNEYKKDEWEEHRGDFLQICLEEFIKKDNDEMRNINDELYIEQSDHMEDMLMLERQKIIWLQWINRNKYMLEKWNKEEWFCKLKKDWEDEKNRYDEKLFLWKNTENDKYINPMLERQKYIWRKWIAKHLYHIDEWENEEWFKLLMSKYEKDRDDLKRDHPINKMDDMEKKKLITKLFIEIHMMVIEDFKKEECYRNKQTFVDTYINEMKKEEPCEKNREMLNILNNIKKDIKLGYENTKMNEWKEEKWFDKLKKEWKEGECKNFVDIEKENFDKTQVNVINNYMLEIQRSLLKKYWQDVEISWIDDDNQTDWLKIAIHMDDYDNKNKVYNRRHDYMRNKNLHVKKKKNIINEDHLSEDNKYLHENNHSYIKRIIEIYMERVNKIQKKEWEENKRDFLKIALAEYIKMQFDKQKNLCIEEMVIKNKNINDDNNGYLEPAFLWNQWVERKRYIMEKWKYEKWFEELKIEWVKEQGIYIKEEEINTFMKDEKKENNKIIHNDKIIHNNKIINNNNDILIESEKIVWRRWLKKQEQNIQIYKNKKWFKDIIVEFEKDEEDDMIMYSNVNDISKVNNKEVDVNNRDNLIMKIWICICMMILEECKKDEGRYNKEIFLNSFIKEIKKEKDEKIKMNMLDMILQMKEKYISKNEKDFYIYDWKKEKWFEDLKNDCKNNKNEYIYMLQNDLCKRYWKDLDKMWLENEDKIKRNMLTNIYEEYNNMDDLSKKEYIHKNINIINENMKCNSEVEKTHGEHTVEGIKNYYLEKQKEIWRQWIEKKC